ncbi:hypothetical protein [Streptomyces sp. NPDC003395]
MPEFRDDSLDLLHVDPDPESDTDATPCHWTDCSLDEGHDDPHPAA